MMQTVTIGRLLRPATILVAAGLTVAITAIPFKGLPSSPAVQAAMIGSTARVAAPVLSAGAVPVAPAAIASASAVRAPALTLAGQALIAPSSIISTARLPQPLIVAGSASIVSQPIAAGSTVRPPTVLVDGQATIAPGYIGAASIIPAPSLALGSVAVSPASIASEALVTAPVVEPGAAAVAPVILAPSSSVAVPLIAPGSVSTAPARIAPTAAVSSPTVAPGSVPVVPQPIIAAASVRTPGVSVGAVPLMPALLASTALMPVPVIVPVADNATLNAITATVGDSWFGIGNPPYSGFAMGGYFAAHPEHAIQNFAKGGQGLDWIISQSQAMIDLKPYVIVITDGRNDFMNDSSGFGYTDAQVYAMFVTKYRGIIDNFRSALPGVAIAVETITERHASDGGADGSGGLNDKYNAYRKTLNAQIRQWKTDGVIAQVIDIGGDPTIGADGAMQPGSAITSDGLHLTEGAIPAGQGYAFPIFANAMDATYAATPIPAGTGDPDVSSFAISPSSVSHPEGDSGSTAYVYTVTRTGGITFLASVDWTTAISGANPASASDFVGGVFPSGTVNFAANATTATITINVAGDTTYEPDEQFAVTISNPRTTGTISAATATGTIVNDDAAAAQVTYVPGTAASVSPGTGGTIGTFAAQSLAAGRLELPVWSDYGRTPDTITVKRTGFSDIALTKTAGTTDNVTLWSGDIPATATDYSIVLNRAANGLINQIIAPIVIVGANPAATQIISQTIPQGSYSPATASNTLTKPTDGIAIRVAVVLPGSSGVTATASPSDGGAQFASVALADFDGATIRFVASVLPASAAPSVNFTPDTQATVIFVAAAFGKAA